MYWVHRVKSPAVGKFICAIFCVLLKFKSVWYPGDIFCVVNLNL